MLIDLHLHTKAYSPCSVLAPEQACRQALTMQLKAIVITEHQLQWSPKEVDRLQSKFPDLKIYSGMEVTLAEGYDLILITENKNYSAPMGLTITELRAFMQKSWEDSFVFLAHAFRYSNHQPDDLFKIAEQVHALEMNSINILGHSFSKEKGKIVPKNQKLYEKLRQKAGLKTVYNSDAHHFKAVGCIANNIELTSLPADEVELAQTLKQAKIQEHQNKSALVDCLHSL